MTVRPSFDLLLTKSTFLLNVFLLLFFKDTFNHLTGA